MRVPPAAAAILRSGWSMVVVFLLSRAAMVAVWRYKTGYIVGDVGYYYTRTQQLPTKGIEQVMLEYPTPVVWGLAALGWLADGFVSYTYVFAAAMLLLDAVFARMLWRRTGSLRHLATGYWLAFIPLVGPLLLFRFDLLPAVLAGGGLLWLASRPRAAGALIGLGAATKLWPALLVAPALAPRRHRVPVLAGFCATGFGLALASLVLGGWDRLVSPLTWQRDRGLQIESIVATPLMWLRTFGESNHWSTGLSEYNAFEIEGPLASEMLLASTAMTAVGMLVIGWLVWRLWRQQRPHRNAVGLVMLAVVAIMILTNKTLSPQYVVWLAGPLAVLLGTWDRRHGDPSLRGQVLALAGCSLVLAGLTQLVYPVMYDQIVMTPRGTPDSTLVLTARNLGLVLWTVWLVELALEATSRDAVRPNIRTATKESG